MTELGASGITKHSMIMKAFLKNTIILTGVAALLISCGKPEIKQYDNLDAKLENVQSEVEYISPEDLKAAIEAEKTFYLIDCREAEVYDTASIPGAINIPRGLIEFQISNKAHDHRAPVYVFCDNGKRSSLVAAELPKLKYSNVKVLDKGFDHWQTAYPDLVELEPVGESGEKSAPPPGAGGCGG
jgi:rhodanese-related sulfurtransferase